MSLECTEIFAPVPCLERGKPYVLGGDPKGKNILYTNSKGVIIRDVANPKKCEVYAEHTFKPTVAKYSPSGYYICSGDESGKIRIWDSVNPEHIKKSEFQPFGGKITDIAWGPESKRIALCGHGREKHAAVILMDTGSNVGKIDFVAKGANSIDYKPSRPYRVAVGDEGKETGIYEGPPFNKYTKTLKEHTSFVQSVRYSPDGKYLATASSDCHVCLYDGKTAELIGQLGCEKKGAHGGGIYSISWSPDSRELLTVSGDKTAKIWDVETKQEVVKFEFGKTVDDMQQSSLWMGDYILTLSLSGDINYLDRNDPSRPSRILHGHAKAISSIITLPSDTPAHVTGDITGKILKWDTNTGEAFAFAGKGHINKVVGLVYDENNNQIISVGWDDKIRFIPADTLDFSAGQVQSLDSQPISLYSAGNGYFVVPCAKAVELFKGSQKVFSLPHPDEDFTPSAFAAAGGRVFVEGAKGKVRKYTIENHALVEDDSAFEPSSEAAVLSFSPDLSKLAIGTKNKLVLVYEVCDDMQEHKQLVGHETRITCLSWSPDSNQIGSAGVNGDLRIWRVDKKRQAFERRAHTNGIINDIAWLDNNNLLTVADESVTKQWRLSW